MNSNGPINRGNLQRTGFNGTHPPSRGTTSRLFGASSAGAAASPQVVYQEHNLAFRNRYHELDILNKSRRASLSDWTQLFQLALDNCAKSNNEMAYADFCDVDAVLKLIPNDNWEQFLKKSSSDYNSISPYNRTKFNIIYSNLCIVHERYKRGIRNAQEIRFNLTPVPISSIPPKLAVLVMVFKKLNINQPLTLEVAQRFLPECTLEQLESYMNFNIQHNPAQYVLYGRIDQIVESYMGTGQKQQFNLAKDPFVIELATTLTILKDNGFAIPEKLFQNIILTYEHNYFAYLPLNMLVKALQPSEQQSGVLVKKLDLFGANLVNTTIFISTAPSRDNETSHIKLINTNLENIKMVSGSRQNVMDNKYVNFFNQISLTPQVNQEYITVAASQIDLQMLLNASPGSAQNEIIRINDLTIVVTEEDLKVAKTNFQQFLRYCSKGQQIIIGENVTLKIIDSKGESKVQQLGNGLSLFNVLTETPLGTVYSQYLIQLLTSSQKENSIMELLRLAVKDANVLTSDTAEHSQFLPTDIIGLTSLLKKFFPEHLKTKEAEYWLQQLEPLVKDVIILSEIAKTIVDKPECFISFYNITLPNTQEGITLLDRIYEGHMGGVKLADAAVHGNIFALALGLSITRIEHLKSLCSSNNLHKIPRALGLSIPKIEHLESLCSRNNLHKILRALGLSIPKIEHPESWGSSNNLHKIKCTPDECAFHLNKISASFKLFQNWVLPQESEDDLPDGDFRLVKAVIDKNVYLEISQIVRQIKRNLEDIKGGRFNWMLIPQIAELHDIYFFPEVGNSNDVESARLILQLIKCTEYLAQSLTAAEKNPPRDVPSLEIIVNIARYSKEIYAHATQQANKATTNVMDAFKILCNLTDITQKFLAFVLEQVSTLQLSAQVSSDYANSILKLESGSYLPYDIIEHEIYG
ncbi:MAG: hypothetical protein KBD37_01185 [Burkholderiales bacterium]|nr:hypothetical protein [Burkholderiales bacterium]